MFWKRTTGHAAFTGLLSGFLMALVHPGLTVPDGATTLVKGGWIAVVHTYPVEMAQNFWTAIIAFSVATLVTVVLSLLTRKIKTDEDLRGLVYSLTPKLVEENAAWYQRPVGLAVIVAVICVILSIIFW
jgi:SSS family solute:Na+ symporter